MTPSRRRQGRPKIVSAQDARRRAYARLRAAGGSGGFSGGYSVARVRRRARSVG
ncbi:MAG: hypothetical protein AB1452_02085 [Pseudomonadota bacterium]